MPPSPNLGPEPTPFWRTRYGIGLLVLGGVGGYFLLTEHLAHVTGALPYLLLLACPLMHVFMHHGHGRHGGNHDHCEHSGAGADQKPPSDTPHQGSL